MHDVLYVKTASFDSSRTQTIAAEIEAINREFSGRGCYYVLVGPGRWGSHDPWLGIPVKWPHISHARVIVEYSLDHYRMDPSQGTHFFQNLTSCGAGYFTIHPSFGGGTFDEAFLNAQPALRETEYLRLVHFEHPITIKIDGRQGLGVVMKPNEQTQE